MGLTREHRHIDMPTEAQLTRVLGSRTPTVRQLYLDTHSLVVETLPGVAYSVGTKDGMIGYGARQYGYDGWGMAALAPYTNWVSMMFMRGTDLDDPDGMLEGTGKRMRHVKLRSLEEFSDRRVALVSLIEAAAKFNQE